MYVVSFSQIIVNTPTKVGMYLMSLVVVVFPPLSLLYEYVQYCLPTKPYSLDNITHCIGTYAYVYVPTYV